MIDQFNNNDVIYTSDTNSTFQKTFLWMFMGLLITGLISFYTYSSGLFEEILTKGLFEPLLILELVVVFIFAIVQKNCSPTAAKIMFITYAILNGLTLSVIFLAYEMSSITITFFGASAIFGIMALYGYNTETDLTSIGKLLFTTLIVCIVVSVINIFLNSSPLDMILSWILLFVFSGITAYDIQKLKQISQNPSYDNSKVHVIMALSLYLDFINIFLRLLSLFGKRR